MDSVDIIKIVEELNQEMYDKNPIFCESYCVYLFYRNSGFVGEVIFCDCCLYSSEFDSEEDIIEAGGFKKFLIKRIGKFIDDLILIRYDLRYK